MGALTSKPFSFAARSWELLDRLAFDCTDTFFSSIKLSFRGKSLMRVLPDFAGNLLSEWISDRVRFSYDALQNQSEYDRIYNFQLSKLSKNFVHFFSKRFLTDPHFFDFVSGQQNKAITAFSGFKAKNSNHFSFDFRHAYYFDFRQIVQKSPFTNYFLLGVNFRYQLPVFAVSFRKFVNSSETFFFNFGFFTNNLIGDVNFGFSAKLFQNVIRGKSKISRIYHTQNSAVFTNPLVYQVVSSFGTVPIYSFFDSPKKLISAEVFSSFSSFYLPQLSLYLPHFFLSTQFFPRDSKLQKFDSPITSQDSLYNFYFFFKNFKNFYIPYSSYFKFNQSVFLYNNYYSHFSSFSSASSSLNVLLALKRQSNSRSNFVYYS